MVLLPSTTPLPPHPPASRMRPESAPRGGLCLRRAEETGAAPARGAAASAFFAAAPGLLPAPPSKQRRGFATASILARGFARGGGQIAAFPWPCKSALLLLGRAALSMRDKHGHHCNAFAGL